MNVSLITGISGQDGAYLAGRLLAEGRRVVGTSRAAGVDLWRLRRLGVHCDVEVREANLAEEGVVQRLVREVAPDEIYHLAGESSVGASFRHPHAAVDFASRSALHLLETVRLNSPATRVLLGSSVQCFDPGDLVDEGTRFAPVSPYAAGKAAATMMARAYRASYSLLVAVLYLGNHESPLRGSGFVTHKVVAGAKAIAAGERETLELGNLNVERDWGWAPEYVDAMIRAIRAAPSEYVIATGRTRSLKEFVELAFRSVGLNWETHVRQDPALLRPVDPAVWRLNPAKADRDLGWKARFGIEEIIEAMMKDIP